jgi:integrase
MGKQHPSVTLEAARAAWLADARFRRLSPVTIREYGRVSGALLGYLAAEVGRTPQLDDLRPAVVRAWLNDRQPPLQPASVAAYVRSLRAFARWCGREYRIADPLAGLRPPRVEPTPVPIFSPDQLRSLLEAAPMHLAYAITLLAESGLRVSEAVAVDLDDIDIDWIQVRRGKGGRARKVPVSALLARATEVYLARVRPRLAQATTSRLLVAGHGLAWTPDSLRLALRRLGARAGIEGVRVSPHTFRHQFAHDVAFGGGSLLALRDALGHRDLGMVARYAVPDDAALTDLLQERTPLQQITSRGQAARRRSSRVSGEEAS